MGEVRNAHKILGGIPEERDRLEDQGADRKVI
jgi:hypothetical protein